MTRKEISVKTSRGEGDLRELNGNRKNYNPSEKLTRVPFSSIKLPPL